MQNINSTKTNFKGAYIIKGSANSVNRVSTELNRIIERKKHTDIVTMPLIDSYNEKQPYTEILICTAEHSANLKNYLQKQASAEQKKLERFVQDFRSWGKNVQKKWISCLQKAALNSEKEEKNIKYPGEEALQKGNPDVFLDWYREMIKRSNTEYNKISRLGKFPFPSKIRRIDADKAFVALIDDNFNIKEGFIRGKSNKIDIEIIDNKEIRYKNDKFHEIITYKIDQQDEKTIDTTEEFYYDKNGKIKKIIKRNSTGRIINIKNLKTS